MGLGRRAQIVPALGSWFAVTRGPTLLRAALVKALVTLPAQNTQFSTGEEPLVLAGRKSCDFCHRRPTWQENEGWRGPSLGHWVDGTRHRACHFSALWMGSSRASGTYVCQWGTTARAAHDTSPKEEQASGTDPARGVFSRAIAVGYQ